MLVFEGENSIAFDVDDTLIMWDIGSYDAYRHISIKCPYDGTVRGFRSNKKHIDLLKQSYGRGVKVIVWSSGGYEWAKAVVKALELEEYVDLILTKPNKLVDDLPVNEIFPCRIYLGE